MMSSNLNPGHEVSRYQPDGRWVNPAGDVVVEILRTHNVRDIAGALLALAYQLQSEPPSTHGVVLLVQSRLSAKRMADEIGRFQSLLRPELAGRIHLTGLDQVTRWAAVLPPAKDATFVAWLQKLAESEKQGGVRASRQNVISAVALSWLRGEGAMTSKALQVLCGASYPTVVAAMDEFRKLDVLELRKDRRVALRYLSVEQWRRIARQHAAGRKVYRYVDPSGQARTPQAMVARLLKYQAQGQFSQVAVGGVLGATRYFPDLDITASPQLDLSVYGTGGLDFMRRLDAGLERADHTRAQPVVVVHVTAEPASFIDRRDGVWASELECYADLLDMGLQREADEMMQVLINRRLSINGVPAL